MTHQELLKILYRNRELIDEAYRYGRVDRVDEELVDIALFLPLGGGYVLNQHYIDFVNSVLDHSDYGVVFGKYTLDLKELVRYRRLYERSGKEIYKEKVAAKIEEIYKRLYFRDRRIKKQIRTLTEEMEGDIDFLIGEADSILDQLTEIMEANRQILTIFFELKELDQNFFQLIRSVEPNLLEIVKAIGLYMEELRNFILQSRRKREQNRRFKRIARLILEDRALGLEEFLATMPLYTFKRRRPSLLPEPQPWIKGFLARKRKESQQLSQEPVTPPRVERGKFVDRKRIEEELRGGCDDLFLWLLGRGIEEREAFGLFLHLLEDPRATICEGFNNYGVRVVRWQS
ncbi:MAG: hypothetical protein C6I05_05455 [Epsilonproteobacteria bacterium]|nr:hypothetical protein [Nitratiruptor sp.]MRJ02879.1 hypothetical protein [Campylobacterota bacterium]NPA82972.1 hypothetical protein [Campylobacterota bacterium]